VSLKARRALLPGQDPDSRGTRSVLPDERQQQSRARLIEASGNDCGPHLGAGRESLSLSALREQSSVSDWRVYACVTESPFVSSCEATVSTWNENRRWILGVDDTSKFFELLLRVPDLSLVV
jgi:hypothetical protein